MGAAGHDRLATLWDRHADQVYAYARRRVGASDAPEVVAEVFAVAVAHPGRVPDDALPWLYRTAWNVIANLGRAIERRARLVSVAHESADPAVGVVERAALLEALASLSDADREALLLTAWEGLDAPMIDRLAHGRWKQLGDPSVKNAETVWTGREVIVWGQYAGRVSEGTAFNPRTGKWRALADWPVGLRAGAIVRWTGTEMIVWGGHDPSVGSYVAPKGGAAYDPVKDTWRITSAAPFAPTASTTATWTGQELVVTGGIVNAPTECSAGASCAPGTQEVAAGYDPATDRWTLLPAPSSSLISIQRIRAAWDGQEVVMLISTLPVRTAVAFDPSTKTWRTLATPIASANPAAADLLGIRGRVLEVAWFGTQKEGLLHAMTLDQGGRDWRRLAPLSPLGICDVRLANGPGVVLTACSGNQVFALDVAANSWRELPRAPRPISSVVWSGRALFAFTPDKLLELVPAAR